MGYTARQVPLLVHLCICWHALVLFSLAVNGPPRVSSKYPNLEIHFAPPPPFLIPRPCASPPPPPCSLMRTLQPDHVEAADP